jgi:hypothetical protein
MPGKNKQHTLILVQYTAAYETRGYMDFESVGVAMDALINMYERKLKELNPTVPHIRYDISDLHKFLDTLTDLVALVCDNAVGKYEPHDRNWIKGKIVEHLRNQAGK